MEAKKYGINIHLIEQLKRFQISLKSKCKTMPPFIADADVIINNGDTIRRQIQAENGRLSIIPFIWIPNGLNRFRPPKQTLIDVGGRRVRIDLAIDMHVTIIFDTENQKNDFKTRLGDLDLSETSSDDSIQRET